MIETQIFRVENYELACTAQAISRGRFEPGLVISKNIWPYRQRTIFVHRGAHPSPQNATESAHAQGIEWIKNFG